MKNRTVSERIVSRMRELDLKAKDLATATKASKGTVSQWVNGGNEPSARYVSALAKVLRVSEKWLLQGGRLEQEAVKPNNFGISVVKVPLLSLEQAASWSENMNNIEVTNWAFTTGNLPDDCFAVMQSGDSMVNEGFSLTIPNGAIVFADPTKKPINGNIVVATPPDSSVALIRRLVIEGPDFYLTPLNDKYSPLKIKDLSCIAGVCFRFQQDI